MARASKLCLKRSQTPALIIAYIPHPHCNLLQLMTTFTQPVRTRSHRGNIPKLPQTKFCSFCPAKFTRTTHLNRHVRSHINQRHYRCDICGSEFTRSDLLSRHKKTCGNSQHIQRSRQKSCQACADSKIKCDLVYPCSKCISRGKVCVFVNDPEVSRMKKFTTNSNRDSTTTAPNTGDTDCLRASPASTLSTGSGSFTSGEQGPTDCSSSLDGVFEQIERSWHDADQEVYQPGYPGTQYSASQRFEHFESYHLPQGFPPFEPSFAAHHMQHQSCCGGLNRHLCGGACNSIPQTAEQPSLNKAWFYDNHVSPFSGSMPRPFMG
ncbi:hypothetical protein E1B28_005999 [Marasmius oreades]|uniref:Uncharacterized protein n=1 Tax=Marasmius oreades TaxID=181124 RepID=A0A9P7UWA7_9AGAR|nr:uncharacterized protein E1B28_005999 [Marasmius oreades]KAG7095224.1 hypothetical protein E1B28_005999 [Marasmius oreades]